MAAGDRTLAELADENRLYEARFGHVFLISAAGRSAEEVLEALRERMNHDAETEIKVAAEEQRKITRLRLESMLHP
jgi:OHCU decarboxylase